MAAESKLRCRSSRSIKAYTFWKALYLVLILIFRIQFPILRDPNLCRVVIADVADWLALLTSFLLNLRQLTAGHIPEIDALQMVFEPIKQVREQSKLKVSRPFHLFLRQVPLTTQAEILAVKPLDGLHHWDAMIVMILPRNGNIHTAALLPPSVLHQLLDLVFEIAEDGDAFFDHGLTSHS